jgi:hypothetical protein
MKKLAIFWVLFFVFIAQVKAEPTFNALDAGDPHYAGYQAGLCEASYQAYRRFYSDRYWLDHLDPKMAGMSPDRREAWVEDYVITTELRDRYLGEFNANCIGAGHVEN